MTRLVVVTGAVRPDPETARSWLERELSRPEYRQSLLTRFTTWLRDLWDSLQASALGASGLSTVAAVLLLVLLVVLVGLVASRVRREPLHPLGADAALGTGQVAPHEHRDAAERALSEGAYGPAIVEAFRAVAARAVQRGIIDERPGRTAHELAGDLGPVFPAHADELAAASALFDRVFYGDQPATGADARALLDLDDRLRSARPELTASGRPGAHAAVPG
jgi:hypothetical protein